MKKILIFLSILFLMSGCGDNNEKLTCSSKSTANGMTTNTDYEIEYKDNEVKFVTITYDYIQDEDTNNADNTTPDTNTTNDITTGATTDTTNDATSGTARNNDTTNTTTDDTDGVNADSDGITAEENATNESNSDDVVDGVVGDTIDGAIDGVTDTILDIAGIKDTYENQVNSYDGIEGFSYKIDTDNDNEYKIIYRIDFEKISDNDLARFNLDRDLDTTRTNYEDLGYTCD